MSAPTSATAAGDHKTRPPTVYPDPYIVGPSSGKHERTFVLLHGGGQEGKEFGDPLLKESIPEFGSLAGAFPNAKFIFPTAAEHYSEGLGFVNRQFFDLHTAGDLNGKDYMQFPGFHDSVNYIHGILRAAIDEVGPENVVLGGLSQGCAVSMLSLLLWEGPPFAAVFGMAGWVPFPGRIKSSWEKSGNVKDGTPKLQVATLCLREILDIPGSPANARPACFDIPVFIGHGVEDDGLLLSVAAPTHDLLVSMGLNVERKYYQGLGHWYSGEMLRDFVLFLNERGKPSG